ncbi:MAG TPA: hypothetical protein VKT18_06515 [Acidimicrobiales bacterium]|nr:hypothetical protein [Acidimicrobiales bacterium]
MAAHAASRLSPSAKTRRRLLWIAFAAIPIGAIALVVALMPERGAISGAVTVDEGPAQLADTHRYRLSAADRRTIDTLLDRFVPAGVERGSPETAWALAGPELRASSSLADWRRGNSPVPFYRARGTRFHGWTTIEVGKRYVLFNLLLQPRSGRNDASVELSGEVIRHGAGWLVNRLYPIATFSPSTSKRAQVTGPNDFAASSGNASAASRTSRLSHAWLIPVLGLVGAVLLLPLALGVVAARRALRFKRASAARR